MGARRSDGRPTAATVGQTNQQDPMSLLTDWHRRFGRLKKFEKIAMQKKTRITTPQPPLVQGAILLILLLLGGAFYWFLLPFVQMLFLPASGPIDSGQWIVRPPLAIHACASAIMAIATLPFVITKLRKRGIFSQPNPNFTPSKRPIAFAIVCLQATVLCLVYSSALIFYLFSWATVSDAGVEEHFPWTTRTYSFENVVALHILPSGDHNQFGPYYSIKFKNKRSWGLSLDNEGMSEELLKTISTLVAERSNKEWVKKRRRRR